MVTDTFKVFQAASQNVDGADVFGGLNAEMHGAFGRMGDGIATEVYVGTERNMILLIKQSSSLNKPHYLVTIAFKTLPKVCPSFSNTNVREWSPVFSSPASWNDNELYIKAVLEGLRDLPQLLKAFLSNEAGLFIKQHGFDVSIKVKLPSVYAVNLSLQQCRCSFISLAHRLSFWHIVELS